MTLVELSDRHDALRLGTASASRTAEPIREGLAACGFFLLFPGFLGYQYGLSVGWWGPFLGGMFAAATIVVATFAAASMMLRDSSRDHVNAIHVLFFATLGYMLAWSFGFLPFLTYQNLRLPVLVESLATVTIWVAVMFVGSRFPSRPKQISQLSYVSILVVAICFAHAFYDRGFPAGPFLAFMDAGDSGVATYQGIGRSLLAVGIVAALAQKPYTLRALVTLVVTILLMLSLGSRAHFVVLCIALVMQVLLITARRQTRLLGLTGITITAVVAIASINFFLETRAAEILDLASSASWDERQVAENRAIEIIAERPWIGAFGYHAADDSGYAHNFLSAWTQYGLAGFTLSILILGVAFAVSVIGYRSRRGCKESWLLALHLNMISIVLALASEPIMSSVFPPLAWGFTLRALRSAARTDLTA